jgi:hypothetical protein
MTRAAMRVVKSRRMRGPPRLGSVHQSASGLPIHVCRTASRANSENSLYRRPTANKWIIWHLLGEVE